MQDWALLSGANNQLRPKRCDLHGFDQMDVKTEWETHLPAVLLRRSSRIVILSRVSRSFTRLSVHCAVFTEHHPTAGAGSVPARPVTVPARYWLGPRRCRLGSRLCWLGAGSVTAGAGSVPARIPPVPACRGSVPARLSAGSVLAQFPHVPARFPCQFLFIQMKHHRLPRDQSALTLQSSDCIQAMPPFPSHSSSGPRLRVPARGRRHHLGPNVCIYLAAATREGRLGETQIGPMIYA